MIQLYLVLLRLKIFGHCVLLDMLDFYLTFSFDLCLRFADCFIAPLIKKKALQAEIKAVDSGVFYLNPMK